MTIYRANTPYDPQERRQGDFKPDPWRKSQPAPLPLPKPGISRGLLTWVIFGVATCTFVFLTLFMHFS